MFRPIPTASYYLPLSSGNETGFNDKKKFQERFNLCAQVFRGRPCILIKSAVNVKENDA